MHPIVPRVVRPARAAAVVLAITILTSGPTVPAMAAVPSPRATNVPTTASPSLDRPDRESAGVVVGSPASGGGQAPAVDHGFVAGAASLAAGDLNGRETLTAGTASRSVVRPSVRAVAPVRPATPGRAPTPVRGHRGRNHVWSGSLGLDRSVSWFPCSRSQPPGPAIYRWGCAGTHNVYLFAHAGGPFRRLHDMYVRGGLRKGMSVTYADASGTVQRYTVAWWKVVLPTDGEFAYAAQSRPSLTLQTCVGPHDRYRLVVRLYQAD